MKTFYFSVLAALVFSMTACDTTKSTAAAGDTKKKSTDQVENLNPAVDLVDHLRRMPGLSITGQGSSARVSIRGAASFNSDTEPLFVVNGTPLNGGLSYASSIVSVNDIKSVKVLKTASETSPYGIRGSSGVIEIILKQ